MPERGRVNRAMAWLGVGGAVVAVLDVLSSFILFRFWVGPAALGAAAPALAVFMVLDLATDLGMASAVIQKDEHTPEVISTVFWLNVAMSVVLTGVVWLTAPQLAHLAHGGRVARDMLRAYTGKIIFQNFYFIPAAMLRRELRFRELALVRMLANLAEFGGKIGFAAGGFGAWALFFGPMCRVVVTCFGVQFFHPWRPRFVLRMKEAAEYLRYGFKTSASAILFQVYTNVDYYVVGHFFGPVANGLYKQAYELVLEPVRQISDVVSTVAFSVFSRLRTNRAEVRERFVEFTRQNLVVVGPFVVLIALAAPELLRLFNKDWVPAADAARVLCFVGALRALSYVMWPMLDGMGYPSLTLTYQTVASIVLPALYVIFAKVIGPAHGYISVAWGWAAGYPIAFGVLALLALTKIELSAREYVRRIIIIPICIVGAGLVGLVARIATLHAEWWMRLGAIAGATLAALGLLLAYVAGISPRTVIRSLKDRGA
jgi:O-antigen/teichoic acid export membrane protein